MESYRDMSNPYTEAEILKCLESFKSLKSYDPVTDTFGSEDFADVARGVGNKRTDEQIKAYQDYYNKYMGGRVSREAFGRLMRQGTTTAGHAAWYASMADVNGDGIISESEFNQVYGLMAVQWPAINGKTYADFLNESDTDGSGDVDIAEFVAWIKVMAEQGK